MKCYVYLIKLSNEYIYTGITEHLRKRILEHKKGNCPLTKNKGKIVKIYYECLANRIEAARREKEIKGWKRFKKENLLK